ncbi:YdcF family protein [Marinovum sp.]|uniref:YdcF family protein n=1 Tax=Marinovum sp. TaxID=2024839 RepID=UPI003A94AB1B
MAFFILSKLLGVALKLETWLLVLALFTFWASLRAWHRAAKTASAVLVLALLGIGLLPLGDALLRPLETGFPLVTDLVSVDGIIVLGGGEDVPASRRSGQPQLGAGGDRYIAALALARAHPEARLVFAGGRGRLRDMTGSALSEAAVAEGIFRAQGLAPERLLFEGRSRNTAENARLSHALAKPAAGEQWVLITSAFHMSRALRSFTAAGWQEITPVPVDFRTWDLADGLGWSFQRNLGLTNLALREWAGRVVYALTGR